MSCFIYAISAGDAVKIGWSADPCRRVSKISSDNPHECRLVGVIPGSIIDERNLHTRFEALRVRREWFRNEGIVAEFVATMPPREVRSRECLLPRNGNAIRDFRKASGMSAQQIAQAVGVNRVTIHRWENGERFPRQKHWARLHSLGIDIGKLADWLSERVAA